MTPRSPTRGELDELADNLGFALTNEQLEDYAELIDKVLAIYAPLDALPEELPPVGYPRTPGYRPSPEEDPLGAWAVKVSVKGASDGILAGRQVVLKDNICLAGVPMAIGSSFLENFVPNLDATVVRRILDAGGEIVGKAKCEFLCRSGSSNTASTGPVRNPCNHDHMTGGSSSGCAALVASGEVTMAVGGDQTGSIRLPSSFCGIYGMKPTWGLVPYTGITPIEHTLDHAGPMSSTVTENALLLEAIAGPDEGLDPRQYGPQVSSYTDVLGAGVDGMKIGVLTEGFGQAQSELDVDEAVREAASRLSQLGARISEISIPEHTLGLTAVFPIMLQGNLAVLRANCLVTNWRGLYPTGLGEAFGAWRAQPNALSETMKIDLLLAEHLERNYRNRYYAKAQNLSRRLRRRYDQAFAEYDVLLMPTVPYKAPLLPAPDAELGQRLAPGLEACTNTGPFSCTGHPAMSVPCGVSNGLPIGMMLVGPWYGETAIYRVAHAFEQSYHQPDAPETS